VETIKTPLKHGVEPTSEDAQLSCVHPVLVGNSAGRRFLIGLLHIVSGVYTPATMWQKRERSDPSVTARAR
jgi:hypothetical protein